MTTPQERLAEDVKILRYSRGSIHYMGDDKRTLAEDIQAILDENADLRLKLYFNSRTAPKAMPAS